jgi:hypothetical protein
MNERPPLVPVRHRMNPVITFASCFFKIHELAQSVLRRAAGWTARVLFLAWASRCPDRFWCPLVLLSSGYRGALSPGVKWQVYYTSTPPYVFRRSAWLSKHRDNLFFKIHFDALPSMHMSWKWSLSFMISTKTLYALCSLPCVLHVLLIPPCNRCAVLCCLFARLTPVPSPCSSCSRS